MENEIIIEDDQFRGNVRKTIRIAKMMMLNLLKNHFYATTEDQIEKVLFKNEGLSVDGTYLAMILSEALLQSLYKRIKSNKKIKLDLFNEKVSVLNFLTKLESSSVKGIRVLSNGDVVQLKNSKNISSGLLPLLQNDTQKEVKLYLADFYKIGGYKINNIPK